MILGRLEDYTVCDAYRQANPETAITVTKQCKDFSQVFETQYSEDNYCAGHIIRPAAMNEETKQARCHPDIIDSDKTCDALRTDANGSQTIGGSLECSQKYQAAINDPDADAAAVAEALCHYSCREYVKLEIRKECSTPTADTADTWLDELQADFPEESFQTFADVCKHVGADISVGLQDTDGEDYDGSTICGRREDCEELCEGDENCAGILMHADMPRCYLTSAVIDGECQSTSPAHTYDHLKSTTGPVKYGTESNVKCADDHNGADTRIPINQIPIHMQAGLICDEPGEPDVDKRLCGTRAQCEAACSATESCVAISAFTLGWGPRTGPRCTLHHECNDLVDVSLDVDGSAQVASKQAFLPGPQCYPSIATNLHETYEIADFNFAYDNYDIDTSSFTSAATSTIVRMDADCHMTLLDGADVIFRSEHPDRDCQTGLEHSSDWAFSAEGFEWQKCPRVRDMRFNRQCLQANACSTLTKCFLGQSDWEDEVNAIKGLGLGLNDAYDTLPTHLCAQALNRPEFSTFMLMSTERSVGMYDRAQQSFDWLKKNLKNISGT